MRCHENTMQTAAHVHDYRWLLKSNVLQEIGTFMYIYRGRERERDKETMAMIFDDFSLKSTSLQQNVVFAWGVFEPLAIFPFHMQSPFWKNENLRECAYLHCFHQRQVFLHSSRTFEGLLFQKSHGFFWTLGHIWSVHISTDLWVLDRWLSVTQCLADHQLWMFIHYTCLVLNALQGILMLTVRVCRCMSWCLYFFWWSKIDAFVD